MHEDLIIPPTATVCEQAHAWQAQSIKKMNTCNNTRMRSILCLHWPSFSSARAAYCACWSLNKVLLAVVLVDIWLCSFRKSSKVDSVCRILFSTNWMFLSSSCIWAVSDSVFSWSWAMLSRSCNRTNSLHSKGKLWRWLHW